MTSANRRADAEALSAAFGVLTSPTRIRVLQALAKPRATSEIVLSSGENGDSLRRQTIESHVRKLVEAGLVRVEHVKRGNRTIRMYVRDGAAIRDMVRRLERMTLEQLAG